MSNKITKTSLLDTELSCLKELSVNELRQELAKSLVVTAGAIVRMAAIIRLLEERGEDLSDIRVGMIHMLRRVASGQVLPELVAKMHGLPSLLKRVARLPIPDQAAIVEDKTIKVSTVEDGRHTHRLLHVMKMTPAEIRRVFADDHIRDVAEQVSLMEQEEPKRVNRPAVVVDSRRGGIIVSGENIFISFKELTSHVAALS